MIQIFFQIVVIAVLIFAITRFRNIQLEPIKIGIIAVGIVTVIRLATTNVTENFIVNWGAVGFPKKCGGLIDDDESDVPPSHTAIADIWSDPQQVINTRIETTLSETARKSIEIEKFLRVNIPDNLQREVGAPIQNI